MMFSDIQHGVESFKAEILRLYSHGLIRSLNKGKYSRFIGNDNAFVGLYIGVW